MFTIISLIIINSIYQTMEKILRFCLECKILYKQLESQMLTEKLNNELFIVLIYDTIVFEKHLSHNKD